MENKGNLRCQAEMAGNDNDQNMMTFTKEINYKL